RCFGPLPRHTVNDHPLLVASWVFHNDRMAGERPEAPRAVVSPDAILRARRVVNEIYVDDKIKEYVLDIVFATRNPVESGMKDLDGMLEIGASPRATIFAIKAAKAHAFLRGRGYVTPEDVKQVIADVLRHRLSVTFEAEAEAITPSHVVHQIISRVQVP
ncbi:MAG: MoxR family ATPase, partial [Chloroflexota bacterium]